MDPKNQDLLEKLWVKIAERYKNEPIVAAYDLLNEPLPENTGAAEKYKSQLVPLYERLIKAIRAVDKKHMFTVEGYNWSNNWSLFDKPLDSNIIYQFHYYCWERPDNLNDISHFLDKQNQLNTPVWVGETGEKIMPYILLPPSILNKIILAGRFGPGKKMDTRNTPYSINLPAGWKSIAEYSEGGAKPVSTADAEKIFDELLNNIKLENCEYFPDVVNAMFRRLPLKVEAENYSHDGFSVSYFVKDTATRAASYRKNEPVPVKTFGKDNSEQGIELASGEWVNFSFTSLNKLACTVVIRVKAVQPAELTLLINGKKTL
ncbi:MAG: cellulase family glycosylhydrolase [Bacteroidales bacterium]|nr:cellulase family glycosylhydrolase [Bacteroidales bacterium]